MLHLSVLASTPNRNSLQDPYWGNYGARIGQPAQRDLYHFCLGCLAGHVPTALSGMPTKYFTFQLNLSAFTMVCMLRTNCWYV